MQWDFVLDKDNQSLVDAGYEEFVQGLAYDTDKDGSPVISEALETACAGQPATSPAVGDSERWSRKRFGLQRY